MILSNKIDTLKCLRSMTFGFKDIGIRKLEFYGKDFIILWNLSKETQEKQKTTPFLRFYVF